VHSLRSSDNNGVESDSSLSRVDFNPQIRYPFKKWQWFTVNTTATIHESITQKPDAEERRRTDGHRRTVESPCLLAQANMLGRS